MDRQIEPEVRRGVLVRRGVTVVIALGAIGLGAAASVEWLRPSAKRSELQFARVTRGAVESTLQASGTVVPLVEQVVSSPVEARVLRVGRRAGDRVEAGDELLTLDTATARLDADRLAERLAQRESETAQLRLRLDETIATVAAQLEQKKLDAEIFRYESEQKETLRAAGLISGQDALAAATARKKSEIEIRQLTEALERAKRSRAAQLAAAANDISIARRDRDESRRQLELAMLRAPRAGVVTWLLEEEGATVRRGDLVARIADLSKFRVVASISDVHAATLAAGMRAHVKAGDGTLDGTVESVDPRIEQGVVKFYVALDDPASAALRNNLRVEVEVVSSRKPHSLRVERGALARTNADEAFVVRGGSAVRVPVRFGLAGNDSIEILAGLREGEEVVISDMSGYEGVAKLRLK